MTTVWLPTLSDQLDRARQTLGEKGAPEAAAADQAEQALRQASDALVALMSEYGLDSAVGWRLHQLRSQLDAHLLAASALADADAGPAVISMLRRSLDLIDPELEKLGTYLG
jgi:hypothetical protein